MYPVSFFFLSIVDFRGQRVPFTRQICYGNTCALSPYDRTGNNYTTRSTRALFLPASSYPSIVTISSSHQLHITQIEDFFLFSISKQLYICFCCLENCVAPCATSLLCPDGCLLFLSIQDKVDQLLPTLLRSSITKLLFTMVRNIFYNFQ